MLEVDYSPDSEQLLSCSADCVHVWCREVLATPGRQGAMEETPQRTLRMPAGTHLRLAKVHPAWTSVLLATNEALEVRELRRSGTDGPQLVESTQPGLELKWRRESMQVTAAAFLAQGNMLVVSDRGDRLLILNYHGLHAAKRCTIPWNEPPRPLSDASSSALAAHHADIGGAASSSGGGGGSSSSSDARGGSSSGGGGGGAFGGGAFEGVCTVTAITECPDVAVREEWRSGVSHLAVANSRGQVVLLKI